MTAVPGPHRTSVVSFCPPPPWQTQTPEPKPLDDNPKTAAGSKKPSLWNFPTGAVLYSIAKALDYGAAKYGRYNWREKNITYSTYIEAALRHLLSFKDGEDCASDSNIHHIDHAIAGLIVFRDAMLLNAAKDDRTFPGGLGAYLDTSTCK